MEWVKVARDLLLLVTYFLLLGDCAMVYIVAYIAAHALRIPFRCNFEVSFSIPRMSSYE